MGISRLLAGYRRFRNTRFPPMQIVYRQLESRGQSPKVMFVACCDSRVDPATIFDVGPGEMFVLRNVANLVPPNSPIARCQAASAALEFAVNHLEVTDIVVMGHAQCGGAKTLLDGVYDRGAATDFIGSWMELAAPARERLLALPQRPADRLRQLEYEIVRQSLENLLTFPWIRERVGNGRLHLHGLHFGIATGDLALFDQGSGEFHLVPLEDP